MCTNLAYKTIFVVSDVIVPLQHGQRRLTVDVDYKRIPLGYKYLEEYHGFKHPLAGTELHSGSNYGSRNQASLISPQKEQSDRKSANKLRRPMQNDRSKLLLLSLREKRK